ncbi:MAG: hypothetical protein AAF611_03850 [Bacteroidota bacterium]
MKKKLLFKKVSIASINHLQSLNGGGTIPTTDPGNGCFSEETAPETTCITVENNCKTKTTRGYTI